MRKSGLKFRNNHKKRKYSKFDFLSKIQKNKTTKKNSIDFGD